MVIVDIIKFIVLLADHINPIRGFIGDTLVQPGFRRHAGKHLSLIHIYPEQLRQLLPFDKAGRLDDLRKIILFFQLVKQVERLIEKGFLAVKFHAQRDAGQRQDVYKRQG